MTQEQKWLSYVAELRSKHEVEMHEYGKELQGKILDQEFTIKSLIEDNRALKEAIEINCNCNADGCHQAKLLQDKDYQIQEAWEKVHALEDDLHNYETQVEEIKLYNKNINDELRKADSHNLTLAARIQVYEEQWHPSKQEQIDDLAEQLNKMEGRANALEEWLTEYRNELKRKVYHTNEGLINDINELLDEL